MPLPNIYQTETEAVATFAYQDIANATGYEIYYAAEAKDTTTPSYHLVTNSSIGSNDKATRSDVTALVATKVLDLDFDLSQFKLQRTVRGICMVNVPFLVVSENWATSSSDTVNGYVIARLRKYSGVTETDLDSAQSETITEATTTPEEKLTLLALDIAETNFKQADILRLTIEVWAWKNANTSGNPATVQLGHDPQNRTQAKVDNYLKAQTTTQLSVHVPFKIDL